MNAIKCGQRVVVDGKHRGILVGFAPVFSDKRPCLWGATMFIIDLDQGFYSEDCSTFVSLLVAHPSNVVAESEATS